MTSWLFSARDFTYTLQNLFLPLFFSRGGVFPCFQHFKRGVNVLNFCRLLGETEDAVKSLTKAADILQITHGTNTSFMKELLLKLEEARAEVAYKRSSKGE